MGGGNRIARPNRIMRTAGLVGAWPPGVFFEGLAVGFSIAAPVGPIGVLCIQRTLGRGRLSGLLTGLGAATADGFYGAVAAFGLTFVSSFLVGHALWFRIIGGAFLLYLGARTFMSGPAPTPAGDGRRSFGSDYLSTVVLTLANPATVLSFIAVFSGLGLAGASRGYGAAISMVTGVVAGSALWWFILSGAVGLFRSRAGAALLGAVNKLSGLILLLFGAAAVASAWR